MITHKQKPVKEIAYSIDFPLFREIGDKIKDAWTGFLVGKDEKPLYYRDLVVSKFEEITGDKAQIADSNTVYFLTETSGGPALINMQNGERVEFLGSINFEFWPEFIEIVGKVYDYDLSSVFNKSKKLTCSHCGSENFEAFDFDAPVCEDCGKDYFSGDKQ